MNRFFPALLLALVACSNPNEKKEMTEKNNDTIAKDSGSMLPKENTPTVKEDKNVLSFYNSIKNNPLKLNHNESYTLPEIREEKGSYPVYDPAYEEPVDQAVVASSGERLSFTAGDYGVQALKLTPCNSKSYSLLLISELMGNYQSYTAKVFKEENGKWTDVSDDAINSKDLETLSSVKLTRDDYEFQMGDNASVVVILNSSKLGPAYKESKPEDPILKTTEEEQNKKITLSWSPEQCKFVKK